MTPKLSTIKLLSQMMAFRPVSKDIEAVNNLAAFLQKYLDGHGIRTCLERIGSRRALYAATRRTANPHLLAVAHLDVVPAEKTLFTLRKKGDWLLGRGVGDCLGHAAVLAQSMIRAAGLADIGAIFSTDEEIGGATTAAMAQRGYKGKTILVLDAGGMKPHLVVAQKGLLTLRLCAKGKACHSAMPWEGINAIDKLLDGYAKIRFLFPNSNKNDQWHSTMSLNVIQGGTVDNRVPDHAEMLLNIRLTEAVKPNDLLRRIKTLSGLKVEVMAQSPFLSTDPRSPMVDFFKIVMKNAFGREPIILRMNGATDARHFINSGAPIIITGLPYENPHASNERASARGIKKFEDFLADCFIQIKNKFAPCLRNG